MINHLKQLETGKKYKLCKEIAIKTSYGLVTLPFGTEVTLDYIQVSPCFRLGVTEVSTGEFYELFEGDIS